MWWEVSPSWQRHFLHADHQGSITAIADDSGASLGINAYDAWGVPNAANQGRFGYTGQTWLPEIGMWYYKARIYSPMLGRFLQTDPIGYKDQVNLYAYVGNDPVDGRDPTGKKFEWQFRNGGTRQQKELALSNLRKSPEFTRRFDAIARSKTTTYTVIVDGKFDPKTNDPPPTPSWGQVLRRMFGLSRGGIGLALITSTSSDTCRVCALTLDGVIKNPGMLSGLTLNQLHQALGTPEGWVWTKSFRGDNAGKGWALREWGGRNWGDKSIRWHPGGGRHGEEPYWRVSSGRYGTSERIPSGGLW